MITDERKRGMLMRKNQAVIQNQSAAANAKPSLRLGWKSRLCCIIFAMFVAAANYCPLVSAASAPCNDGHNYKPYYNNYAGIELATDYCQNCGYIKVHPCRYSLRFMTVGTTYSYAEPSASSTSKLLTNSARHNVNVTGRVRNQDGDLWLLLDDGTYIPADSVAFNFDYYAEDAVKNVSGYIDKIIGTFFTYYPLNKTYDMKQDDLLGNTYPYKLYSSGIVLPERYSGEQIGNMIYGYTCAAKEICYSKAIWYAEKATEKEDSPEDKYSILLGHNYRKNGVWLEEVSSCYIGKTVTIKSVEVDKYVSSNTDQTTAGINAIANRNSADTWERFTVEEGLAGAVGFRSTANGNYLSARIDENEQYSYIQAAFGHDYSQPQSWESFRIFEWNGIQYIQSQANGKWIQVSVEESDYPIKAAADAFSTWERFQLEIIDDNTTASGNAASGTAGNTSSGNTSGGTISASTIVSQYYWGSNYNEGWYEGEYRDGKPNGYGKLTYDDFEDGIYYSFILGDKEYKALYYEGYFCDGWRCGAGKVAYEDGWVEEGTYYGVWSADKKVFEGTFWHKDGIHYLEGYLNATSAEGAEWKWQTDTWQRKADTD